MQGRLLPKYKEQYQAHPVGYWQDEFFLAKKIGLDCIEFILDYNDADINPLISMGGINEIQSVTESSGVTVKTICADYFMEAPLHSEDPIVSDESQKILVKLLGNAYKLGVTNIVVPCVDQSTLGSQKMIDRFVDKLTPVVDICEKFQINIALETDLAPQPFVDLLNRFDSNRITVNYDIGNSAALGYNPLEELDAYGELITDIHIKDRILGGGPVILGDGNADFDNFFRKLEEVEFSGVFIMQAYRDDEGVDVFNKQLEFIKVILQKYNFI